MIGVDVKKKPGTFPVEIAGIDVTAGANALSVTMVAPSPPAPVDGAGGFTQNGNIVAVNGTINVNATGLADGQVPEGPQAIAINDQALDLDGTVTQVGDDVILFVRRAEASMVQLLFPGPDPE